MSPGEACSILSYIRLPDEAELLDDLICQLILIFVLIACGGCVPALSCSVIAVAGSAWSVEAPELEYFRLLTRRQFLHMLGTAYLEVCPNCSAMPALNWSTAPILPSSGETPTTV